VVESREPYPAYTEFEPDKKAFSVLQRMSDAMADLVWPPECPLERVSVDRAGHLSPQAWGALDFISDPACQSCGFPLPYETGGQSDDGLTCGACLANPPRYDWARAPLAYDDTIKPLVLALKNADRRDMLPLFARWMAASIRDRAAPDAVIIPVPLFWRRLLGRRYNQSALLARALALETGLAVDTGNLHRRRVQFLELGRQKGVKFTEGAAGGNHPGAVADHAVEPGLKTAQVDRIGRVNAGRIVGGKCRHHGHDAGKV